MKASLNPSEAKLFDLNIDSVVKMAEMKLNFHTNINLTRCLLHELALINNYLKNFCSLLYYLNSQVLGKCAVLLAPTFYGI